MEITLLGPLSEIERDEMEALDPSVVREAIDKAEPKLNYSHEGTARDRIAAKEAAKSAVYNDPTYEKAYHAAWNATEPIRHLVVQLMTNPEACPPCSGNTVSSEEQIRRANQALVDNSLLVSQSGFVIPAVPGSHRAYEERDVADNRASTEVRRMAEAERTLNEVDRVGRQVEQLILLLPERDRDPRIREPLLRMRNLFMGMGNGLTPNDYLSTVNSIADEIANALRPEVTEPMHTMSMHDLIQQEHELIAQIRTNIRWLNQNDHGALAHSYEVDLIDIPRVNNTNTEIQNHAILERLGALLRNAVNTAGSLRAEEDEQTTFHSNEQEEDQRSDIRPTQSISTAYSMALSKLDVLDEEYSLAEELFDKIGVTMHSLVDVDRTNRLRIRIERARETRSITAIQRIETEANDFTEMVKECRLKPEFCMRDESRPTYMQFLVRNLKVQEDRLINLGSDEDTDPALLDTLTPLLGNINHFIGRIGRQTDNDFTNDDFMKARSLYKEANNYFHEIRQMQGIEIPQKYKKAIIIGGGILGLSLVSYAAYGMISKIKNRPRGPRKVVCLGDSITADGVYGKILESKLPEGSSVTSLGYVGQGVRVIYSHLAEALRSNPTDLVVLAGVNDLGGGRKAKDIIVDLELLWTEIKRSGARLVVIQILPWAGYPTSTPAKQAETKALNKLIKNSKIPDAIVNTSVFDNGSGRLIGAAGSGDGLHPGKEGKIILGRLIHEQGF